MTFLTVLIVFVLVQWWGSGSPLHQDTWFTRWVRTLNSQDWIQNAHPSLLVVLALAVPCVVLSLILWSINSIYPWLQLLIAVPLLLYCLGRGKYTARVSAYKKAWENKDWQQALASYTAMHEHCLCDEVAELDEQDQDWPRLHDAMLSAIAYRGFERMFTVLFWFVAFAPVGALLYRLSSLLLEELLDAENCDEASPAVSWARHWLWVLEWPVVRVLSLSFALTGNFVSCVQGLQKYLLDTELPTATVLRHFVYGALNLDADKSLDEDIGRVFKACLSLLSRTLILWICVLAVVTLW